MAGLLVVFFPMLLLAFLLFMERVEEPLRRGAVTDVEEFLDNANSEDVNNLFRYGIRRSLERWRNRRRRLPKLAALVNRGRDEQPSATTASTTTTPD